MPCDTTKVVSTLARLLSAFEKLMTVEEPTNTSASWGWLSSLRLSNPKVWQLAAGRALNQIGAGLINFYIPIVFVNEVGLSAASVGFSFGLVSLTEVVGHLVGGPLADSPKFGRKRTLMIATGVFLAVSLLLTVTHSVPLLIAACLLMGFGLGGYWTTVNATVIDITLPEERHQAYAIVSVADNLGVGMGVLLGGAFLTLTEHRAQLVFAGCALIFVAFLLLAQIIFSNIPHPQTDHESESQGLWAALKDRCLLVYMIANSLFTGYVALVTSTIPLYFTNFVPAVGATDAALASTAKLFTWCYIAFGTVLQLPLVQLFNRLKHVHVLMVAMLLWATGFSLVWGTGIATSAQYTWGVVALCTMSIASVLHKPFAAAILSELAPANLRATYVAVGSQSWAIGFFIAPIFGGWAMDHTVEIADRSWLVAASTTILGLIVLKVFEIMQSNRAAIAPVTNTEPQTQEVAQP